jgi:hypothetical protein
MFWTKYWEEGDYQGVVPPLDQFTEVAKRIRSDFFTMDIAKRKDGQWMIVELGDAQVAGLPEDADVMSFYRQFLYKWPKKDEQPTDVQEIITLVQQSNMNIRWTRLWVRHPGADDDGLWFFWIHNCPGEVQIESSFGKCPFIIETDKHNEVATGNSVREVATKILEWLALPGGSLEIRFHPR